MMPLRTIPPLNILDATLNNAGIVLHLDAELNHMLICYFTTKIIGSISKINSNGIHEDVAMMVPGLIGHMYLLNILPCLGSKKKFECPA